MTLVWEILPDVDHQAGLALWGPCQLFRLRPNANKTLVIAVGAPWTRSPHTVCAPWQLL